MARPGSVAAVAAAMVILVCVGAAQATNVGAMAEVRRNVYGMAPERSEAVKRVGDAVVFKEQLQTLDESGALVRFVDNSRLTLGAKSRVVIDAFVFNPTNAEGNAVIDISLGTLRWVTGDMPKGGTVIRTPTATLMLRGTEIIVHVHPDGTTDATVIEGKVEAVNNITKQVTSLIPGNTVTLGHGGTTSLDGGNQHRGMDPGRNETDVSPEQRRGAAQENASQRSEASTDGRGSDDGGAGSNGGGSDDSGGGGDGGGGHDNGGDHDGGHHGGHHDGGDGGSGSGCGCK